MGKEPETLAPVFEREDRRGSFVEAINRGTWASLSHGTMRPGAIIGQHYHKETELFFYLTDGSAEIVLEDVRTGERRRVALAGRQGLILRPFESHRIRFLEESRFILLKSRAYAKDDPDTFAHPIDGA